MAGIPRNGVSDFAGILSRDMVCQRGKKQEKGNPKILASSLSGVVQAQKDRDGAAARIPQGEEIRLGVRSHHRQVLLARAHKGILFVHSAHLSIRWHEPWGRKAYSTV